MFTELFLVGAGTDTEQEDLLKECSPSSGLSVPELTHCWYSVGVFAELSIRPECSPSSISSVPAYNMINVYDLAGDKRPVDWQTHFRPSFKHSLLLQASFHNAQEAEAICRDCNPGLVSQGDVDLVLCLHSFNDPSCVQGCTLCKQ